MKQVLYILVFILLKINIFSQSADMDIFIPADTSKKAAIAEKIDKIESSVFAEEEDSNNEEGTEDAENHIEIAELYGDFNSNEVHQYKYKEVFQSYDSLIINLAKETFVVPCKGKINSHYGWRRYRPHYGTDIDLNKGDSVKTAFDGVVRYVNKKVKGYGQVIVVRHFNGFETVYAHLSKILVNANDTLKAGDIIGLGGNTGRSTGPHLHFEIRCLGVPINSEDIIDYESCHIKTPVFVLTKKDAEETYNLRSKKYQHLAKSVYIVKKGDTLSGIARKTGVSLSVLMKKNKLRKNAVIKPGRKIYL